MADKNWHASSTILIHVQAAMCVVCAAAPARAFALSDNFAPPSHVGKLDPNLIWEVVLGGIAVCSFLAAIVLWIYSALRRARCTQLRRNAFVSSALDHLNQ